MATNEVKLNGEVILSTRGDTVSEENLMKDETATDSAGEKITGKLEPVDKNDAYLVSDEIGDISDEDYIPFNDVSDVVTPKKKIGVLSFFEKLKSVFLPKETSSSQFSLDLESQVLHYKSKTIDASKTDNDVSAITYPSTMCILDSTGRIIMRTEAIVNPDGNIGWKSYVRNYNTNGNVVNQKGILYNMDKSGNLVYRIDDENAFRKAIKTIDQVGTRIEANSDLDDYINAGSYYVKSDADASDISNVPIARSGKLIVLENDYNDDNTAKRFYQMYFTNDGFVYFRFKAYDDTFTSWKRLATYDEISPSSGGGSGFAEGTVSGSAISATISGFQLNTGVIVSIGCPSMPANATLNINNTGAKSICYMNQVPIKAMDLASGGTGVYTFIYDGTVYRIISYQRTPSVGIQSYVADTSGNLVINAGYDSNAFQLKYNIAKNKLLWNAYKNSVWNGDKFLADYDDLITQYGINIPDNSDLNNYKTAGVYNITTNNSASTIANTPINSAGKLVVLNITSNDYKIQIYIDHDKGVGENTANRNIFIRNYTNYNSQNYWSDWHSFAETEDLNTAIAKVGKSIVPEWEKTTNKAEIQGITYSFEPISGAIVVSGTATAESNCILWRNKANGGGLNLPKGRYRLQGCPSGGGEDKFYLGIQLKKTDGTEKSYKDYGDGVIIDLDQDAGMPDTQNFFIRVKSGYAFPSSGAGRVFYPMLVPAWASTKFEPCEDIHKGNCYVGTCTTGGSIKDKVAYVDGYCVLRKGVRVAIKFTNSNTYSSTTDNPITLNVNQTGAKNIWYGTNHSGAGNTGTNNYAYGSANRYIYYVYDGTYWVWSGISNEDNTVDPPQLGFGYGTCSTAESTLAKEVTLSNYNLRTGGFVCVYFSYSVLANSTLNINGKGAKNIRHRGANIISNTIRAGDRCLFVYNGGQYDLLAIDRLTETKINYSYNNSAGTPNYIVNDDTHFKITQLFYVVEGDIVQVSFNLRFDNAVTYSSNTKLFHGLLSPRQTLFGDANGKPWYMDGSGFYIRGGASFTAGTTVWNIGFTYIKSY